MRGWGIGGGGGGSEVYPQQVVDSHGRSLKEFDSLIHVLYLYKYRRDDNTLDSVFEKC